MTYIPNPENKAYVCHKDNVPYHKDVYKRQINASKTFR